MLLKLLFMIKNLDPLHKTSGIETRVD